MELKRLKVKKEDECTIHSVSGSCLDCDWQDDIAKADIDYEWDEFKGNNIPYPICPKCGGGVEVN